jgi:hypothetical protein
VKARVSPGDGDETKLRQEETIFGFRENILKPVPGNDQANE